MTVIALSAVFVTSQVSKIRFGFTAVVQLSLPFAYIPSASLATTKLTNQDQDTCILHGRQHLLLLQITNYIT